MLATNWAFGSHNQDVRLNPDLAKLLNAVLSWLRLGFTSRLQVRHQRQMNEHHILFADVERDLSNGFQEWQTFDVSDGAAQFCDNNIDIRSRQSKNRRFDFVSDMRHNLNGPAEIFAATFFFDHRKINLTGRVIRIAVQNSGGESFVMAEVKVGLGAVIQDVNLTVLVRAHCAWIDVQIRIQLLHADFQTASFQQHSNRGRR